MPQPRPFPHRCPRVTCATPAEGAVGARCHRDLLRAGSDLVEEPVEDARAELERVDRYPLVDAMTRSLLAEDPDALVAPFLMSGGTDAKHFRKLDMRSYGFAPLRLPADLDFTSLFHGVDERVPVDALEFGARVFDRFLDDI